MSVGRISQVDRATLAKLQAGCNYINAEVARLRKRVVIVGVVCAAIGIASWVIWRVDPRLPIFGAFGITMLVFGQAHRQLAKSYKGIVVGRIVAALGQGLAYKPESSFTKQDFLEMDLFNKRCEQWKSEDEIEGRKNQVSYSLHEAKATRTEGSGKHRRTVTIFKGLIVRLDFNKNFAGRTIVIPQSEGEMLGGLFGESESRGRKEIVRLENADFENTFTVYATSDQEARYLLTPKLMELVLEAQTLLGADVRLSFHDNSVFVTIPQNVDRFEVGIFGAKITPETAVGELVEVVGLAERLVDTLDLETRIWTRV